MYKKLIHIDTETTGTIASVHSLVEIGAIVEINGEIRERFHMKCRPIKDRLIEQGALDATGYKEEEMRAWMPELQMLRAFTAMLHKYITRSVRSDRLTPAGWNVSFDIDFLINWMATVSGNKWEFWNYMTPYAFDGLKMLYNLRAINTFELPKYKLEMVCKRMGIELLNAHDAMADIEATRQVNNRLMKKLKEVWV